MTYFEFKAKHGAALTDRYVVNNEGYKNLTHYLFAKWAVTYANV